MTKKIQSSIFSKETMIFHFKTKKTKSVFKGLLKRNFEKKNWFACFTPNFFQISSRSKFKEEKTMMKLKKMFFIVMKRSLYSRKYCSYKISISIFSAVNLENFLITSKENDLFLK